MEVIEKACVDITIQLIFNNAGYVMTGLYADTVLTSTFRIHRCYRHRCCHHFSPSLRNACRQHHLASRFLVFNPQASIRALSP